MTAEEEKNLKNIQQGLRLRIVDFSLTESWNSHVLIGSLRKEITPLVERALAESEIPFDPQDLEHQTLFYLTTFKAGSITKKILEDVVAQQAVNIKNRLKKSATTEELNYLFRGLKKFYPDLNSDYRLKLKWENETICAVGDGRHFEIEFKKITDQKNIALFTDTLHYIHQQRSHGDTFAFFFKGDRYPWAIETTESSVFSRPYKRAALLAHGFHPNKGIELTRFYSLPGSPLNAMSVMDGLVKHYYAASDVQVLFTRTMPAYSKSKATTIAGGLNKVLCITDLEHSFIKRETDGVEYWEHVSRRWVENHDIGNAALRSSHDSFNLLKAVDVFMPIKEAPLAPRADIAPDTALYFSREDMEHSYLPEVQ
ncbi:MAG: hypothetical protein HYT29_01345 [Parcubacteria group bacterium]|nr:hypothetical protein [Parcubacteria group bacterium]